MEQTLEVQATISVLIPEDKILVDKVEYHELIIVQTTKLVDLESFNLTNWIVRVIINS